MLETEKIENKEIGELKKYKFFNKKRTLLLVSSFLISFVLIGLTIKYVLNIDFQKLGELLQYGFSNNLGIFFILILWSIFSTYTNNLPTAYRLKKLGYNSTFLENFLFNASLGFLASISPANLLTDPFVMFWIKSYGVSNSKTLAIVSSNGMIAQILTVLITIPSFCVACANYHAFVNINPEYKGGEICFWLIFIGLIIDIINISFFAILCFSKKFSYVLSLIFNKIKKVFHLKHHTKEEVRERYINQKTLQRDSFLILKDWKGTLLVILRQGVCEIFSYVNVYFCILWICKDTDLIGINFLNIFNAANISVTASKMIPVPGGFASYEYFIQTSLLAMCNKKLDIDIINNSTFINRCWNSYLQIAIGIFAIFPFFYVVYKKMNKNKVNLTS